MSLVEIDTIGAFGLIADQEPYTIDSAAWSTALNVRFEDGVAKALGGRESVFGTLPHSPLFLIPVATNTQVFWLWASSKYVFVWDGITHTEVTRLAGPYNAGEAKDFNGVVLGGIAVLNNGADVPQAWLNPTTTTRLVDLPNWPANTITKAIRALGPYLIAVNVTAGGVNFPHRVKWSHPAVPGAVPESWDVSDPTKDAGENELPDVNSGVLQDLLPLAGQMFLYKDNATWRMSLSGNTFIFNFAPFLETSGLLAPRCVGLTPKGDRHFVVTQDDVILHDGNTADPILDRRFRRRLFSQLDATFFSHAFVFSHQTKKEMWFCYPEVGEAVATRAVVWNAVTGTVSEAEVDFVAAAAGPVEIASSTTWASVVGTWASYVGPWSVIRRRETIVANKVTNKVLQLDVTNTNDGVVIPTTLQRVGVAILGRKRDKSPIVDHNRRKQVTRIWPRMTGGPVNIRIGAQDQPGGAIRWSPSAVFNPAVAQWVDLIIEGAAIAIEVASAADVAWTFEGYKIEFTESGGF